MSPEKEPQSMFNVAVMSLDDTEAVTKLRTDSWLDTYINEAVGVTREWIEERNKTQLTPEHDAADNIIGVTTPYRDEDGTQHVGSLYVNKEWHGKGVAAALMQKVIDWADPTLSIELRVATYSERAKAFYRKWGFEEVPNSETLFDGKIPEVKMVRKGES